MGNNVINKERSESKDDILKRLRRIEGQVKGIHKMIEEDKQCVDILTQVSAVRAAINSVGGLILQSHSKTCLRSAMESESKEKVFEDLMDTIQKFLKFVD
jgi:DNA-binding FrmR family transcriptional regulator